MALRGFSGASRKLSWLPDVENRDNLLLVRSADVPFGLGGPLTAYTQAEEFR